MSLAGLPRVLFTMMEQDAIRRRTGLDSHLCWRCGDWSELDSVFCEWCDPRLIEHHRRGFWGQLLDSMER